MVSNKTTPTVIVDRNGKVTTVHKSTSPRQAQSSIPAPAMPSLPPKKGLRGPTAQQLKVTDRKASWNDRNIDGDLRDACITRGVNFQVSYSDAQMYEVIGVVKNARNAELLFSAGITTPEEAVKFLKKSGLSHLIDDTRERVAEAVDRRIPVHTYIETETMRTLHATEYLMDALELTSHKSVSFLRSSVLDGSIKLKDIKYIGYKTVSSIDNKYVRSLLQGVSSGDSQITAKDIVTMREKSYTDRIFNLRLELAQRHGPETGVSITGNVGIGLTMSKELEKRGITDDEYASKVVKFAAQLHNLSTETLGYSGTKLEMDDYFLFHDTGLTPEEIMEKRITKDQARAIKDGRVSKSIATGWL